MNMNFPSRSKPSVLVLVLMIASQLSAWGQEGQSGSGVAPILMNQSVCLSTEDRIEIQRQIQEISNAYEASGGTNNGTEIRFESPVRQNINYDDHGVWGISNFVDHNPMFVNRVQDYNCGSRTYDTSNGYNHSGTDMFSWPFAWQKMDNNQVEVVAAAPGQIILKQGANQDKSCAFNSSNWNAIYIRHSDGSVAWYGHLKQNSLTTKLVGQTVEVGEFLGIMGSSGNSTGPHLHFEVHDKNNKLIDPYVGSCNNTTDRSWWVNQESYSVPKVNKIMTHSAIPLFGCYDDERPNHEVNFNPGDRVYFATYFRDQSVGSISTHKIIRPDGSVFQEWTTSASRPLSASYRYRSYSLPGIEHAGTWTFTVDYFGESYSENFYLQDPSASNVDVSVSVEEVVFEDVSIGTTEMKSFDLINNGDGGLLVESITYPDFFRGSWNGVVHSGDSKKINITFTPEEEGTTDGTVEIKTNYGTYNLQVSGSTGCREYSTNQNATICQGDEFMFGDQVLSVAGDYQEMYQSVTGCDSLVNLSLSVTEFDLTIENVSGRLTVQETGATYQWLDCDNSNAPIEDATTETYIPQERGNYAVSISKDGCESISECVLVDVVLGITENEISPFLNAFPNPTAGQITIDFGGHMVEGNYEVVNAVGEVISSGRINNETSMEVSLLGSPGVYLLRIVDKKGRRSIINLIKK